MDDEDFQYWFFATQQKLKDKGNTDLVDRIEHIFEHYFNDGLSPSEAADQYMRDNE